MHIPLEVYPIAYRSIVSSSRGTGRGTFILVKPDVDALCAARLLHDLLKGEYVNNTIIPVRDWDEVDKVKLRLDEENDVSLPCFLQLPTRLRLRGIWGNANEAELDGRGARGQQRPRALPKRLWSRAGFVGRGRPAGVTGRRCVARRWRGMKPPAVLCVLVARKYRSGVEPRRGEARRARCSAVVVSFGTAARTCASMAQATCCSLCDAPTYSHGICPGT